MKVIEIYRKKYKIRNISGDELISNEDVTYDARLGKWRFFQYGRSEQFKHTAAEVLKKTHIMEIGRVITKKKIG